jgi:hypothetical protein
MVWMPGLAAASTASADPTTWIRQAVPAPGPVTVPGATSAPAPASSVTVASDFGAAVVIQGKTAFVGAPFTTVAGKVQQGAVYVFREGDDRSWSQSGMLTASDGAAYAQFGGRLAVSGATLMVGAPGVKVDGHSAQGAAYVFTQAGGSWSEAQKLTASDGAAGDEFGSALALSGTTALVGARYGQVGANKRQGAAYVFAAAAGSWSEAQKLTASDGAAGDLFGSAVALDGSRALIGASAANVDGNRLAGAVYAFSGASGTWTEAKRLTASDGAAGDLFGSAIALSGAKALIGAPDATGAGGLNQGEVYAFADAGGVWSQTATLTAQDGAQGDQFGGAIRLHAARALIGSAGSGRAYLFDATSGGWTLAQEFAGGNSYGAALDFGGRSLLVGAPSGSGAVDFYERTNLGLAISVPAEAKPKSSYTANAILTNNAASASPPLSLVVLTPAGASLGSAESTQGSCKSGKAGVACVLGQVAGNGGEAKVDVKLTVAAKKPPATLDNVAEVSNATPPVTASAAVSVPQKHSGGGGGGLGLGGLLALLGLMLAAGVARYR